MFKAIFGRGKKDDVTAPSRAAVPADYFVVAVGDLHGRLDLLEQLWVKIDAASRLSAARRRVLIFIGDYVDRGLQSAQLVERLLQGFPGFACVFLKGNHDATLLQFLGDPSIGEVWRNFGGLETLRSYGVVHSPGKSWAQTRSEFISLLPQTHEAFFKNLRLHYVVGDYVFVHAGMKPRVPLEEQREADLLWIREEFLESTVNFGRVVVHGHTPTNTPEKRNNRIGIDTGAYMTGNLTAVVLEGRSRQFLSTS